MSIESVLMILLWIVVIFAIGWLAHWVISTFFPEPIRTPAMLFVGVLLLILAVYLLLNVSGLSGRKLGNFRLGEGPALALASGAPFGPAMHDDPVPR